MEEAQKINELDKISVRFSQFIIAVNGALIAYSMKQIEGEKLTLSLIPLGLAILFWGFSFYSGISSIRRIISTRIIQIFKERERKKNPTGLEALRMINQKFESVGAAAEGHHKRMFYFLYIGSILFIGWQVLEMYLITFPVK